MKVKTDYIAIVSKAMADEINKHGITKRYKKLRSLFWQLKRIEKNIKRAAMR